MEQNSNVEVQNDQVDKLIKEIKYTYKIYKRAAAQVNILDDKMDAVEIRMKRAIEGRSRTFRYTNSEIKLREIEVIRHNFYLYACAKVKEIEAIQAKIKALTGLVYLFESHTD